MRGSPPVLPAQHSPRPGISCPRPTPRACPPLSEPTLPLPAPHPGPAHLTPAPFPAPTRLLAIHACSRIPRHLLPAPNPLCLCSCPPEPETRVPPFSAPTELPHPLRLCPQTCPTRFRAPKPAPMFADVTPAAPVHKWFVLPPPSTLATSIRPCETANRLWAPLPHATAPKAPLESCARSRSEAGSLRAPARPSRAPERLPSRR